MMAGFSANLILSPFAEKQQQKASDPSGRTLLGRACADRGILTSFLVLNVFHRGLYESTSRSNWTMGPIASLGESIPVFLRKPVTTCDFPEGSPEPLSPTPWIR